GAAVARRARSWTSDRRDHRRGTTRRHRRAGRQGPRAHPGPRHVRRAVHGPARRDRRGRAPVRGRVVIRLLIAAAVGMGVSLFGTRWVIVLLTRHNLGQHIREEGPQGHVTKAGTPTMGGIAIVVGAFAGWVV